MTASQPDSLGMYDSMEIDANEEEEETISAKLPLNEMSSEQLETLNPFR